MFMADTSLQATNQLLTALDRFRNLPNILVCCTSNLIEAIVGRGRESAWMYTGSANCSFFARILPSLTVST